VCRAPRSARPRSAPRGTRAAPAATAPTPTRRRRRRGRGNAARNRGRARAGGPRRPVGRQASSSRARALRADPVQARRGVRATAGRAGQGGTARFVATRCRSDGIAPKHVGVRAAVHLAAALALAALAFAIGRWLRDPSPGGSLLILLGAAILWGVAVRRVYRPGGLGRPPQPAAAPPPPPAEPPDDRIDLNGADVLELQ